MYVVIGLKIRLATAAQWKYNMWIATQKALSSRASELFRDKQLECVYDERGDSHRDLYYGNHYTVKDTQVWILAFIVLDPMPHFHEAFGRATKTA